MKRGKIIIFWIFLISLAVSYSQPVDNDRQRIEQCIFNSVDINNNNPGPEVIVKDINGEIIIWIIDDRSKLDLELASFPSAYDHKIENNNWHSFKANPADEIRYYILIENLNQDCKTKETTSQKTIKETQQSTFQEVCNSLDCCLSKSLYYCEQDPNCEVYSLSLNERRTFGFFQGCTRPGSSSTSSQSGGQTGEGSSSSSGAVTYDLDAITGEITLDEAVQQARGEGKNWVCKYVADEKKPEQQSQCGNGAKEGSEECDDGNNKNDDGCSSDCKFEVCGDGIVNNENEECDDGKNCANGAKCVTDIGCKGIGDNSCDPRSGDGCSSNCVWEKLPPNCGNSKIDQGERCDDGNRNNCDGCNSVCARKDKICGDGIEECGEECDDYNLISGDGCSRECKLENPPPSKPEEEIRYCCPPTGIIGINFIWCSGEAGHPSTPKGICYNSGIIPFKKDAPKATKNSEGNWKCPEFGQHLCPA